MRQAVDLVSVGESVAVNARIEAADEEAVEEAVGRRPALAGAAHIADGAVEIGAALLPDDLARNDLHAAWNVSYRGVGLAELRRLLKRSVGRALYIDGRESDFLGTG